MATGQELLKIATITSTVTHVIETHSDTVHVSGIVAFKSVKIIGHVNNGRNGASRTTRNC
jgi:glyoxylase-like metal-dependent hydrolase (beta-lactamase superfamily II)